MFRTFGESKELNQTKFLQMGTFEPRTSLIEQYWVYYVFQINDTEFQIHDGLDVISEIHNPVNGILIGSGSYADCENIIKNKLN